MTYAYPDVDTYGFRAVEEIVDLWRQRRETRSPAVNAAEKIKDAYNGALTLPYSERLGNEKSGTPNLIFGGIDQTALRIASVAPNLFCPPTTPGQALAEKRARERRRAILGWWKHNELRISDYRRARWYVAYTCAPVVIRPGGMRMPEPRWFERDPLSTFPAETERPDDPEPPDCVFAYRRTYRWLQQNYGFAYEGLEKRRGCSGDDHCLLLEYADDREVSVVVVSDKVTDDQPASAYPGWSGSSRWVAVERLPNRTGMCPAVVPGRISLDRPRSPYEDAVGMSVAQNLLFALELEAVIEDVWQNEWITSPTFGTGAKVVRMADGRKGIPGVIEGGDIKVVRQPPGYMTNPTRDYLERNIRVTTGQPAEYGGESQSNVRTGRRGEQIIAATVDFPIAEAQTVFARSKEAENRRAVATAKAYFGDLPRSFYVSWPGARGPVDYTPNKTFETDENIVTYPATGTDIQNLTIMVAQLRGTDMMSTRTAMEMHPFIEDAEQEFDRVQAEALRRAGFAALQAQAEQGAIPPTDVARIAELIETDQMEWWDAVNRAQKEAQERQAPDTGTVPPGAPEAQPGIAQPGMGAEAASAIPGPGQGQQAIAAQLRALYPVQAQLGRSA